MRIIVTTTMAPFVTGGAEYLAKNLITELTKKGHEVELINIPMTEYPRDLIENGILTARLLELEHLTTGKSDLLIGLKFPAYFAKHSNKVIWALHQYREAYDLWKTDYSEMHTNPGAERIRKIIMNADNLYLKEAKGIYTISQNVSDRMQKYNQISSKCLYHPCPDMEKFYQGKYKNYILMPSRICLTKRQTLAVEALMHTKSNIELYIVGTADHESAKNVLLHHIKEYGLEKRVKLLNYVTQEEKLKLYANARAVMFIPYDEDYGYITLEGMSAGKALITATDSGGSLEFIENGKTGIVVKPNPTDLAKAIDEVANSVSMAKELGKAAKKRIGEMDISWENVVKELTK